jgi:hypothetical protein
MALDITSLYDDLAHYGMRWGASSFVSLKKGSLRDSVENRVALRPETREDGRARRRCMKVELLKKGGTDVRPQGPL